MVKEAVVDTNVLKDLDTGKIVVSSKVSGEMENQGIPEGLVGSVEKVDIDSVTQCVNDNIQRDITKKAGRGNKSLVDNLKESEKQRSEQNRQEFLRRSYEALPSRKKGKSWQGEVAGARTDCSVLELGKKKGKIYTNDRSILDQCKDVEDITCEKVEVG